MEWETFFYRVQTFCEYYGFEFFCYGRGAEATYRLWEGREGHTEDGFQSCSCWNRGSCPHTSDTDWVPPSTDFWCSQDMTVSETAAWLYFYSHTAEAAERKAAYHAEQERKRLERNAKARARRAAAKG